jgi:hypothetical protein
MSRIFKNKKQPDFKGSILLLLMIIITRVEALQKNDKLWLGFNAQTILDTNKKWLGSLTSQARFTKQSSPVESDFVETCLGYQLVDYSLWVGYRYTKHINNKPSFSENRLIQQCVFNQKNNFFQYWFRSRLEERYRSNQKQVAVALREKVSLEFSLPIFCRVNPLLFNEIFIPLNKTIYTSRKLIDENRLFVGCNCYIQKTVWWEIGYILQYRTNTSLNSNYQLNHILSINYNYK